LEIKDTTVYLPSDIIRDTLTFEMLKTIDKNVFVVDSVGKAKLTYYIDAYNRLIMNCESKPDTVFIPRISETIVKEKTVHEKGGTPVWAYVGIGFCWVTIIALSVKLFAKFFAKKKPTLRIGFNEL